MAKKADKKKSGSNKSNRPDKITQRMIKDKARILVELEKSFGIVMPALKRVRVAPSTFYKWQKEDEDFAKAVEEVQDNFDIIVEDKLKEGILQNDSGQIRFYLSHKVAKYKPKVEMSPMEGNNFSIEITTTKAKKNGSNKS